MAWSAPCLRNLDKDCLDHCLAFVITPELMSCVCAVSKTVSASAHRPAAWCGTVVDASGLRPAGKLAMTHFKCWSGAKAVVGGSWERGSLSLLVDGTWVAWAFVHLHQHGANMLVSRLPVPSADVLMMFCVNRTIRGQVFIGIATNTGRQEEITNALRGKPPQGAVAVAAPHVRRDRKGISFCFSAGPAI